MKTMDRRQLHTVGPYDAPDRSDLLQHPDVLNAEADQVARMARYNKTQDAQRLAESDARDLAAELSVRATLAKRTVSFADDVTEESMAPIASPKVVAARLELARWFAS